jgi:hypothetical protein
MNLLSCSSRHDDGPSLAIGGLIWPANERRMGNDDERLRLDGAVVARLGTGCLVDNEAMCEFDVRCLTQTEGVAAKEIESMREEAGVGQTVFARAPNVATVTTRAKLNAVPRGRPARR